MKTSLRWLAALTPVSAGLVALACGGATPPADEAPVAPAAPEPTAPTATSAEAEPAASGEVAPPAPAAPKPVATWAGMKTPESVLVDGERYLVSNINGKPLDKDGNGFISELSPDGSVKKLDFIQGGAKVKLDAPKGMAITGGVLFVADIDVVRWFDAKTGAPKGDIKVEGATFLNDVAAGPDGKIYVSDSGLKQGASDFEPTGTDAVYVIEAPTKKGAKPKPVAKSADLNRPNGLSVTPEGVVVSIFGGAELYRLDATGKRTSITPLPVGGLDGLVPIDDGFLVSSWAGKAVLRGKLGGEFKVVLPELTAPADIGWDANKKRVLVPRFMGDVVEAYELP
jgi:DNA-binding beta-propeller fold protein YncE